MAKSTRLRQPSNFVDVSAIILRVRTTVRQERAASCAAQFSQSSQSSYSTRTTTASFASDDDPVFYEDDRDKYLDLRVKGEVSEKRAMVNAPVPVSIPLHHPKPRRHHNIKMMHSLAMDFGEEEVAYGESEVEIPRTPVMDPVPLPPVTPSPLDVAEDDIPDWKSEVTFLEYLDELEGLEEVEAFESGLEWSQIRQWADSILMNFGD
ncbi:hypothetical protein ABKN59_011131 [Abortiporus biennis]